MSIGRENPALTKGFTHHLSVNRILDYPLKNTEICLNDWNCQIDVVDEFDQILDLLSKEDNEGTLLLPYWAYLWESSIGLAEHLSDNSTILTDKRILEIGCGYGLPGIVAAKVGAIVTFTDFEHDALQFARHNSQQNDVSADTYVQMDWGTPCFQKRFDVVLGSDVIYEEKNWDPIIELLYNLLVPKGIAIFSEPKRKNADGFFERIQKNGFSFKRTTRSISLEEKTIEINIFQVKHAEC